MNSKKIISLLICITALFMLMIVCASASFSGDVYYIAEESDDTIIRPQEKSGTTYLFLPSSADLTKLVLGSDTNYTKLTVTADKSVSTDFGMPVDILSLFDKPDSLDGEYKVTVTALAESGEDYQQEIIIMKSENISSLFIVSEDPENKGRSWIDTSKSNKAKGSMVFLNADGTVRHADEMTEIKARGNSTFTDFTKKAYQFKIKSKAALTGGEDNAQKKWVLLANAGDITLIHNSLVVALANDLNIPYTIDCEPVDLYYDGEYRGSYIITDKVEVGDTGVDIQDLDGEIEDINEGTDAYEDPVVVTKTRLSGGVTDAPVDSKGSYKYVSGLIEPELPEGCSHHGYLLELDFIYRYPGEQSGFVTDRGQAVVTKNPEYLTKETGAFISQFYQDFEDAVFSPDGYNAKTGKYYYEYCDLDSLVKIYLINEYTKNYDSYRSSTFFYLPEDEDIMYAGPTWDYDLCFTTGYDYNSQIAGNPENFWAATKYLASTLITIESFRDAVKEYLNSEDGEFYLAASNMLGEDGNIMKFSQAVYASQRMNYKLWDIKHEETAAFRCGDDETYDNGIDFLLEFATKRLTWLSETTSEWEGDNYSAVMDPTKWSSTTRYHNIVTIEAREATCTKAGCTAGTKCGTCGKVFTKSNTIPAKGHKWADATCTTAKTCTICGETDDKSPATGHNWTQASCQAPSTCKNCGIANPDAPQGDHIWKEATCSTPKTCTVCGETPSPDVFGDHDWEDATCTVPRTCRDCGLIDEEAPLADHKWTKPTCTDKGKCTVCNAPNENAVLAEHSWTDPTCKDKRVCTVCGEKDEETPFAEHTWAPATCTAPATCKICGLTEGDRLPHKYELDPEDSRNSDTCIVYKCNTCDKHMLITVVPGPKYEKGDVNKDGKVTAADARLALRMAAKIDSTTAEVIEIGDMNDDKKLTAADARLILRKSAKLKD